MEKFTWQQVKAAYDRKGYIFHMEPKKINIFGIRSSSKVPDAYDDWIGIAWMNGDPQCELFEATTDPGLYYLKSPLNVNGTSILMPGQYVNSHTTGIHYTYRALVQRGVLRVWRDNDRDAEFDYPADKIYTDASGINIHFADIRFKSVGPNSAGCQVIHGAMNWEKFMTAVDMNETEKHGRMFNYTLFDERDMYGEPAPVLAAAV